MSSDISSPSSRFCRLLSGFFVLADICSRSRFRCNIKPIGCLKFGSQIGDSSFTTSFLSASKNFGKYASMARLSIGIRSLSSRHFDSNWPDTYCMLGKKEKSTLIQIFNSNWWWFRWTNLKDCLEKCTTENQCRLKVSQRIAKSRHMAKHQPTCVVNFVRRCIFIGQRLTAGTWRFKVPVVHLTKLWRNVVVNQIACIYILLVARMFSCQRERGVEVRSKQDWNTHCNAKMSSQPRS